MLEIYLSTIFLWMIIIFCTVCTLDEPITKNGWSSNAKNPWEISTYDVVKALIVLLLISAVPILRAMLVGWFYVMSKYTEKQVDEWLYKHLEAKHDE